MLRKLAASLLILAALATLAAAVPGVVDSIALACDKPNCG